MILMPHARGMFPSHPENANILKMGAVIFPWGRVLRNMNYRKEKL